MNEENNIVEVNDKETANTLSDSEIKMAVTMQVINFYTELVKWILTIGVLVTCILYIFREIESFRTGVTFLYWVAVVFGIAIIHSSIVAYTYSPEKERMMCEKRLKRKKEKENELENRKKLEKEIEKEVRLERGEDVREDWTPNVMLQNALKNYYNVHAMVEESKKRGKIKLGYNQKENAKLIINEVDKLIEMCSFLQHSNSGDLWRGVDNC